jgi:putative redox protein
MTTKTATLQWAGTGLRLEVETGSGHHLVLDDAEGNGGPRPAELLVVALGGCTAMDVVSILRKKRQVITRYQVRVTGEQRDDRHPHVYRTFDVLHVVEGPEVDEAAVRRAIELSAYRYCTVTAQLAAGIAEIRHRYLLRRAEGDGIEERSGEVAVTGPAIDPDALALLAEPSSRGSS